LSLIPDRFPNNLGIWVLDGSIFCMLKPCKREYFCVVMR
jgi:hypothetical protein